MFFSEDTSKQQRESTAICLVQKMEFKLFLFCLNGLKFVFASVFFCLFCASEFEDDDDGDGDDHTDTEYLDADDDGDTNDGEW